MIYVYHGKNKYESWLSSRAKLAELSVNAVVENADEESNISFSSIGLFKENKVWFIKRFFSITSDRLKALWDEMGLFKDLKIVIWEDKSIDKRLKVYKEMIDSGCKIYEFEELKPKQAEEWIRKKIGELGLISESKFIEGILSKVGIDQYALSNELTKVKFYLTSVNRSKLDYDDLEIVSNTKSVDTWDFVQAFYTKEKSKAIKLLEIIDFEAGKEIELLGGLASVLKSVFIVLKYGMNSDYVAKELNIHPFVMRNARTYANHFNLNRIEKLYEQILNLDYSFKRSEIEPKMGFGLLTASL